LCRNPRLPDQESGLGFLRDPRSGTNRSAAESHITFRRKERVLR